MTEWTEQDNEFGRTFAARVNEVNLVVRSDYNGWHWQGWWPTGDIKTYHTGSKEGAMADAVATARQWNGVGTTSNRILLASREDNR